MAEDVIQFPTAPTPEPLLEGPFESWRVRVQGRFIPRLTGYPQADGRITLVVDGRFAADFEPEAARQAAWLIAEALAIGEGYAWLGAPNKNQPFAPFATEIDAPA